MNSIELSTLEQIYRDIDKPVGLDLKAVQTNLDGLIQEYLNTTFDSVTYTSEVYDSKVTMLLRHMPIISVTSLTDLATSPSTLLTSGEDYYVYPDKIYIPDRTSGYQDLSITYKAGLGLVPSLVKVVAEDLARYWAFKISEGSFLFYQSQKMEDREYEGPNVTERTFLSRLRSYKQASLGSDSRKPSVRLGLV